MVSISESELGSVGSEKAKFILFIIITVNDIVSKKGCYIILKQTLLIYLFKYYKYSLRADY